MTLLEVVIALALAAVGMLLLAEGLVTSQKVTRESIERSHARARAEARLGTLRGLLRQDGVAPDFQRVIAQHGATADVDLLDDTAATRRMPAVMTTRVFTNEFQAAQPLAAGGVGLVGLDLNADGTTEEDVAIAAADLRLIAVEVTVTWRPGSSTQAGAQEVVRVVSLLY